MEIAVLGLLDHLRFVGLEVADRRRPRALPLHRVEHVVGLRQHRVAELLGPVDLGRHPLHAPSGSRRPAPGRSGPSPPLPPSPRAPCRRARVLGAMNRSALTMSSGTGRRDQHLGQQRIRDRARPGATSSSSSSSREQRVLDPSAAAAASSVTTASGRGGGAASCARARPSRPRCPAPAPSQRRPNPVSHRQPPRRPTAAFRSRKASPQVPSCQQLSCARVSRACR